MANNSSDTDVLIVGAGPTGLMLALELAQQHGVSFRIVDKQAVRSDKSRAVVLQCRALELINRHAGGGLVRELTSRGTTGLGLDVHVYGRRVAAFDLHDLGFNDTVFPLPLWISQAQTERVLEEALVRQGHAVQRAVAAVAMSADGTGVDVTLVHGSAGEGANGEHKDGEEGKQKGEEGGQTERIRCKYVVGCDGAHSVVRRAAGISFDGGAYLQNFALCDAHLDWPALSRDRLTMLWDRNLLAIIPLEGDTVRLIAARSSDTKPGEDPTLDEVQQLLERSSAGPRPSSPSSSPPPPRLYDPIWLASFRLHHRCAGSYASSAGRGRLLLAGDAAHIHSPAGGQGMNAGIGDAVNLGWKLARVVRGDHRGPALLASYDAERRPVGERLLRWTDRMFAVWTSTSRLVIWLRNNFFRWLLPVLVRAPGHRGRVFSFMSQLKVRYRRSSVVGTAPDWRGAVRGGDRAPDGRVLAHDPDGDEERWFLELCRGPGYHFAVFTGATTAAVASSADVERALKCFGTHSCEQATVHIVTAGIPGEQGGWGGPVGHYLDIGEGLHRRYGFDKPGYVLIRPDGHVEYIGLLESLGHLEGWLRSVAADGGEP